MREAVLRHVRDRRLRRRWVVLAGALALSFVPLIGTLGYESALVLAPILSLLAVGVAVDQVRDARTTDEGDITRQLGDLALAGARELGIVLGIVLGVLLVGQLWQLNCDPWTGVKFFVIGPTVSAALGWICGLWGATMATRRRDQLVLGATPFAWALLVALWRLYFDPVVFAYDPFWGYFSGSIYDENVPIRGEYWVFRGYNLLAGSTAVLLWTVLVDGSGLRPRRPDPSRAAIARLVLAGVLALSTAWIGLRGDTHGFTASFEQLTKALPGVRTTEHFVIHYAPRSTVAREIDAVAAEHEFAWHRLREILGREPGTPVHSFMFAAPGQKRALMGAGRPQIAAPWRGHMYLNAQPFPHDSLHHELAHVFAGTIGDPVFGLSPKPGLIEGVAEALAPRPSDRLDQHDIAAVLDRLDKRPRLRDIMGLGFWTRSGAHAYTAAGSFCRWLLDTRGVEPMTRLYGSFASFEDTYGESLDTLEDQWGEFLRARQVRQDDVDAHAERFRRRSVFRRPCAHRAASLLAEVGQANDRGQPEQGIEPLETLCRIEPDRVEHRVGLAAQLARARKLVEARRELATARAMDDLTVTIRAQLEENAGDVALTAADLVGALEAYSIALRLPLAEGHERVLQLKQLGASDDQLAPLVAEYFGRFAPTHDDLTRAVTRLHMATRIQNTPGFAAIGHYLVGRQLLNIQHPEHGIGPFERSIRPGIGEGQLPSDLFVRAARLALLGAYVQTQRYDRARAVLDELEQEPGIGSGHRMRYAYWRERIEFFTGYVAPASG